MILKITHIILNLVCAVVASLHFSVMCRHAIYTKKSNLNHKELHAFLVRHCVISRDLN